MNRTVRMPLKTESTNCLLGMHHFARAKLTKMHRTEAWKCMRSTGSVTVSEPLLVTLTRESAGILDDDNLRGAIKAIRDGVADWLGVPDNDPRVTWAYAQRTVPRKQYAVEVCVQRIDFAQR